MKISDESLKELKLARYILNPALFIKEILGFEVKDFHKEWIDAIEKNNYLVLLAPRGFGKTTIIGGYIIWKIITKPDIRILIVTVNQQKADEMMSIIKGNLANNEKIIKYFGEQVGSIWSNSRIRVKNAGIKHKEPTLQVLGLTSSQISSHYDLIILDDIVDEKNSATEHRRNSLISWYNNTLIPMLEPGGKVVDIGCVKEGTKVLKGSGEWVNIEDLLPGDFVWSWEDNKFVKKQVNLVLPQGKARTIRIKTKSNSIETTYDHPFLKVEGDKYNWSFKWVKAEDLKVGDYLVVSKLINTNTHKKLHNGITVNHDILWLFGYWIGDGYLSDGKRPRIGFSGTNKIHELEKVKKIFESNFAYKLYKSPNGALRNDSKFIPNLFKSLGFSGNSHTKRIPKWVYHIRPSDKRAFIQGIIDADGSRISKNTYRIELANKKLIEDIKLLSMTCGIKTGNILYRKRDIKAPSSKVSSPHDFWSLSLYINHHNKFSNKRKFNNIGNLSKQIEIERIYNIEDSGLHEVWDVGVEGNSNFIANGFVVHNTRWHASDIHSYLSNLDIFKTLTYKAIIQEPTQENPDIEPKVLWPERFPYEDEIRDNKLIIGLKTIREKNIGRVAFAMQYQNEIIQTEDSPIKLEWVEQAKERWDELNIPPNIKRYIGVDLASKTEKGDYFSITVIGKDEGNNIYVLDSIRDRLTMAQQLEVIKEMDRIWEPISIGIESNAAQKIITDNWIESTSLPIVQLKSSWINDKWSRVQRLSVLFETGRIILKPSLVHLIDELIEFPRGRHDDSIDSLSFAIQVSERDERVDWNEILNVISAKKSWSLQKI